MKRILAMLLVLLFLVSCGTPTETTGRDEITFTPHPREPRHFISSL